MDKSLKEQGNEYFKVGNYEDALIKYIEGTKITDIDLEEKVNLMKNQSMCYLKLNNLEKALESCCEVLKLHPKDEKSLYRRSQVYLKLENLKEAYNDAKQLIILDNKNKLYQTNIKCIQDKLQSKVEEVQSFSGKVNSMFDLLAKTDNNDERVKCINNLTVLAREHNNECIWKHKQRSMLIKFTSKTCDIEVIEAAQRCLSCLAVNSIEKSLELFTLHGPQYFADMIYSNNSEHCRLAGLYLESILSGLTQLKAYKSNKEKFDAEQRQHLNKMHPKQYQRYKIDESVQKYVTDIFVTLVTACNSKKMSAAGRDSILEILLRFVPSKEGVDFSRNLLNIDGALVKLLEVGAASHKTGKKSDSVAGNISLIDTTPKTKMTVAILLAQIYDDLVSDQSREKFRNICCDFVLDLLSDDIMESKVEAANLIGLLFQGPYEAGSAVLGRAGILEGLLLLMRAEPLAYRRVALDAIVLATTKKDKCMAIVKDAVPILEEVYKSGSSDNGMRVRALVGLSKLGVAGGRDASIRSLGDGSTVELAKSCMKMLTTHESDEDKEELRRWAAEGLAYLTLDAEVKEVLLANEDAVKFLLSVTKNTGLESLYPLCTVLVNVTNSYDKQEVMPELLELAKYAKQHIPEEHKFDSESYVKGRIDKLMKDNILTHTLYMLTQLSDSTSSSQTASREMIARIYLSVVTYEQYRGAIIQAGGGKSVISLANNNSDVGKTIAGQALAKLTITMDPRVAYPGQRSLEVIRPLINMLDFENSGLQNFEALLGLTNLASLDDIHRRRIFNEQGLSKVEHYMFEEHELLRRAATECMCNLVQLDEVRTRFLDIENDRVKALVLYCAEVEDPALIRAASGALASLSTDPRLLTKLTKVNNWLEILQILLASDHNDIKHRGAYIVYNLFENGTDEFFEFIVKSETRMLEVLMALTKLAKSDDTEPVIEFAQLCLNKLAEKGLIKPVNVNSS